MLAIEIRRHPSFRAFSNAFDGYLRQYGHRETTSPLLVTSPTWRESPATVLGAIMALVSSGQSLSRRRRLTLPLGVSSNIRLCVASVPHRR